MNSPEKTQEPPSEQFLKLLDRQMAVARDRRTAREASRSKTGVIGIVVIVAAATIALGLLLVTLEQMRPPRAEKSEPAAVEAR